MPVIRRITSPEIGLNFDGVNDRIDWFSPLYWGVAQTLGGWLYVTETNPSSPNDQIFNDASSTTSTLPIMLKFSDPGLSVVQFSVNYTGNTCFVKSSNNAAGNLPTQEWAHLLVTWDGSSNASGINIYINGAEPSYAASQNGTGSIETGQDRIQIGGKVEADTRNTAAVYSGWARWDRVLTANERARIVAGANPKSIPNGLKWCPDFRTLYDKTYGLGVIHNPPQVHSKAPKLQDWYRSQYIPTEVVAAAGGLSIPIAAYHHYHHNLSQT